MTHKILAFEYQSSSYMVTCEVVEADKDFPWKLKRTARYSKNPSCTAVKEQRDWQNGAANESGNVFDFGVRAFPLCGEVEKTSNWHTAFRTHSYFPSQRQKIILQTWRQYLKHASKGQIGGKKKKERKIYHKLNLLGQRQKTSWLDWWSGGFPHGRK